MNRKTRTLTALALNCLLLIIMYFASGFVSTAPPAVGILAKYVSYLLFAAGMFFGWRFNRSRVFFCCLTLALSQFFLADFLPSGMDRADYYDMILPVVSVYIPLNLLVFSVQKERGLDSAWGRMRLLLVFIEALIAAWIIWYNDTDLLQLFEIKIFPWDIKPLPDFSHLSLLMYAAVLAYLFTRELISGKNNDSPFIGIAVFSFAALLFSKEPYVLPLIFAFSGLTLLAVVIQASYAMAYLDELTALPSRRALKEEMHKLSGSYAIAMLDIDHFKKFNDTHGHDVGDDVLKLVAACIKGVGGGGKPFRYGGEEFTIVFPGKTADEALPSLEELREAIAARGFVKRSRNRTAEKPEELVTRRGSYKKLYLTVSIGIAEKNERHKGAEEVITAADKALYRAKSKGRNCVCK